MHSARTGWLWIAAFAVTASCVALVGCGSDNGTPAGGDSGTQDGTAHDSSPGSDVVQNDHTLGGDTGPGHDGSTDGNTVDSPFNPDGSPTCVGLGAGCSTPMECCSNICTNGACAFPACTSDGQACANNGQCCSGICGAGGTCTPLNNSCKTLGNACTVGGDCCSMYCANNVCAAGSFCGQTGDTCQVGANCCSDICTVPAGQVYGTCNPPPTGAANCSMVDGTVCGGVVMPDSGAPAACGGPCCSRNCAPYGPTGLLVCQPASGCHVVGDVCLADNDCCGAAPGACNITAPNILGVCRNPLSCKPNGDVCKLATSSCNSSCDCCAGNCQVDDTCHLDNVGVPRCGPAVCAAPGQSCASSADCCNGVPCVPNPALQDGGVPDGGSLFVCYTGGQCVPSCGACTVNADCCPGESCIIAQGSTMGICGPCAPPPPDGGVADGSAGDGSVVNDGAPPPDAGTTCSLYGQSCTQNSNCCNGVPCSNGTGPCLAGETTCTCHYPIN